MIDISNFMEEIRSKIKEYDEIKNQDGMASIAVYTPMDRMMDDLRSALKTYDVFLKKENPS